MICDINNFIYCLSRLLHTYLSQYDKLSRYMSHHCVKDVNIGDTCNNEVLNYNTANLVPRPLFSVFICGGGKRVWWISVGTFVLLDLQILGVVNWC